MSTRVLKNSFIVIINLELLYFSIIKKSRDVMSKLFHPKRRTLITLLGVWSYFVGNVLVGVKDVYTYIK